MGITAARQTSVKSPVVSLAGLTSCDFTGIPAWATEIDITFWGVSANGTSNQLIQIGDAGGVEVSGYSGGIWQGNTSNTANTVGFLLNPITAAAQSITGRVKLRLADSANKTWLATISGHYSAGVVLSGAGAKALSDVLDRVRLTTANGTDVFDAGFASIQYN